MLRRYIVFGETTESEANMVIIGYESAKSPKGAWEAFKARGDYFEAQKSTLTDHEVRIAELGKIHRFYVDDGEAASR